MQVKEHQVLVGSMDGVRAHQLAALANTPSQEPLASRLLAAINEMTTMIEQGNALTYNALNRLLGVPPASGCDVDKQAESICVRDDIDNALRRLQKAALFHIENAHRVTQIA